MSEAAKMSEKSCARVVCQPVLLASASTAERLQRIDPNERSKRSSANGGVTAFAQGRSGRGSDTTQRTGAGQSTTRLRARVFGCKRESPPGSLGRTRLALGSATSGWIAGRRECSVIMFTTPWTEASRWPETRIGGSFDGRRRRRVVRCGGDEPSYAR